MMIDSQNERPANDTLGDPRTVTRLLSIVTGRAAPGGTLAVRAAHAGRPTVEVLPHGWDGQTLSIERTPSEIRTLCDEGIIGAAAPWKRPRP